MEVLICMALFLLLDYAALRWGYDSRDAFAEPKQYHSSIQPLY
jgi:hypothetical protein